MKMKSEYTIGVLIKAAKSACILEKWHRRSAIDALLGLYGEDGMVWDCAESLIEYTFEKEAA